MIIYYRLRSESPNMRKVTIMLEEIGCPYAINYVDHQDVIDYEFAKISPNGTVPAIVDSENGVALFESTAILQYLSNKTGVLQQQDIGIQAAINQWLAFEASNVCPAVLELHHYIMNDGGDLPQSVYRRYEDKLIKFCEILNRQLQDKSYLAGEFSIADIALAPWVVTLPDIADIDLDRFEHLQQWWRRFEQRPSALASVNSSLAKTDVCFQNGRLKACQ